MRSLVLLCAYLAVTAIHAAAPPPESPQAKYDRLREAYLKATFQRDEFGPRLIAHADKYPKHPSAIEALLDAAFLEYYMERPKAPTGKAALMRLEQHYARSPIVEPLLISLGMNTAVVPTNFLRQTAETNPELRIRALAWRAMIHGRSFYIRMHQPDVDQQRIKGRHLEVMQKQLATWRKEVEEAREKLKSTPLLGVLPDVSVGAKAPATVAMDLDGKKVSLADHKGKVIVLDFWHVHNDSYLKHTGALNERMRAMKGKPYIQIGVCISDLTMTRNVVQRRAMAWPQWSIEPYGKQYMDWDIMLYPTVYVIDHEGIIRHHQVGFNGEKDKLNDVVRELVKKAEAARK